MAVGTLLALAALAYVLYPLIGGFGVERKCAGCGAKLESGARFCRLCGAAAGGRETPAP
jgi:predicted amidophosphoribosyltransferase